MTAEYSKIHNLGCREIPENKYINWLLQLKEECNTDENKEIINFRPLSE